MAKRKYTVVGIHLDTHDGYIGWQEAETADGAVAAANKEAKNDFFHPVAVFVGWLVEEAFD